MCHMRRRIHVPLAMTETPNTHKKIKISQSLSRDPAICHIHTCHTCTHVSVSVWKEPLRNTTHTFTHVTHATCSFTVDVAGVLFRQCSTNGFDEKVHLRRGSSLI